MPFLEVFGAAKVPLKSKARVLAWKMPPLKLGFARAPTRSLFPGHYRELVKPDEAANVLGIRPATQTNLVAQRVTTS
jgi:hypothetical protein